jgi:hypothetical protein
MRGIIDYIRSCFCKHDWHIEEKYATSNDYEGTILKQGDKVYMRCKTCGYNKTHWKY